MICISEVIDIDIDHSLSPDLYFMWASLVAQW